MLNTTNKVVVSQMAYDLKGNQILKIAYQVRDLKAKGHRLADLTIGDFHSPEFGIPPQLNTLIQQAYADGLTNYPPSMGLLELRKAVAHHYYSDLGVEYTPDEILVASGTRPLIFAAYMAIVDPSEKVVYGVPSWNNNHYCHIVGAFAEELHTWPSANFMPTPEAIEAHMGQAVLVALNSPQNPSGTMMQEAQLRRICEVVLKENAIRDKRGAKPCYVLYDHVYWQMTYGQAHIHPVALFPEMKNYTIYADGASKNLAGTGIRVGWAAVPPHLATSMANILAHMGAWAPKPEQVAIAQFLPMREARRSFMATLSAEMRQRLDTLHGLLQDLKAKGLIVDSLRPQGGLFLSVFFGLQGYTTPDGLKLKSGEDIRNYLLNSGKCAFVPFAAFGDDNNAFWYRAAVSGLSHEDFQYGMAELEKALLALKPNY